MILDMVKNTTEQALISIVIAKVEDIFKNEATGHDASHTIRVYKTAKKLCDGTGANTLIVSLASLLHDVDDVKIFPTHINDEAAREIMFELKINEDEKEQILHIIHQVSFVGKDSVTPDTLEGKIVQDADRLDALGAIGIARAFAYGGNKGRKLYDPNETINPKQGKEEYRKNNKSTIAHFYEKLLLLEDMMNTEKAREIAHRRTLFMKQFLDEFYLEWDGRD